MMKTKKAKKLLALFLVALMLFSCLGAIQASALTQEEAVTTAAEWNDSRPDLSSVYANMSAKQAKTIMTALDSTLAFILQQKNLAGTIYSNETMSKLFLLIFGEGTYGNYANTIDYYNIIGLTQVGEALSKIHSLEELKQAQIDWGITPGDSEAFKRAVFPALLGFQIKAGGMNIDLLTILVIGYELVIIPVFEALHTDNVVDTETMIGPLMGGNLEDPMATLIEMSDNLLNPLVSAINQFIAHPISYLCEILPDLVYTYGAYKAYLDQLPDIDTVINGLLAQVGESTGIAFPDVNVFLLAHMGTAEVTSTKGPPTMDESYMATQQTVYGSRVTIVSDQPMVFAAITNYAGEVLKSRNNQAAIGRLITEQVGPEYLEDYDQIIAAAKEGNSLAIAQSVLDLVEHVSSDLAESENTSGIVGFFAKIAAFFSRIFKKILEIFAPLF